MYTKQNKRQKKKANHERGKFWKSPRKPPRRQCGPCLLPMPCVSWGPAQLSACSRHLMGVHEHRKEGLCWPRGLWLDTRLNGVPLELPRICSVSMCTMLWSLVCLKEWKWRVLVSVFDASEKYENNGGEEVGRGAVCCLSPLAWEKPGLLAALSELWASGDTTASLYHPKEWLGLS